MAKTNSLWAGQPRLPDSDTVNAMLPSQVEGLTPYKDYMRRILRINDEQLAINRYRWYNVPYGLDGQLIERILYYRGEGMMFYIPETESFAFLPYCLNGSIDIYGRYTDVKPLPFMGTDELKTDSGMCASTILNTMTRVPVYDINISDALFDEALSTKCVLLSDYSKQLSQVIQPRQKLNDGLIDLEANIIPYINTLLSNSTGVSGMRVNDEDEKATVIQASDTVNLAALNGKRWVPISSPLELQDFASSMDAMRTQDMLLAMQSIDNLRLETFGLANGGIFEKKQHMLNAEVETSYGTSSLVMDDGLYQRQRFCNLVNSWFLAPLGVDPELFMWVEVNPTSAGVDINDGVLGTGDTDAAATASVTGAAASANAKNADETEV